MALTKVNSAPPAWAISARRCGGVAPFLFRAKVLAVPLRVKAQYCIRIGCKRVAVVELEGLAPVILIVALHPGERLHRRGWKLREQFVEMGAALDVTVELLDGVAESPQQVAALELRVIRGDAVA